MRYTITFPIPIFQKSEYTYDIETGLFRDIATQSGLTEVRILCLKSDGPLARNDVTSVDLRDYPNLSIDKSPSADLHSSYSFHDEYNILNGRSPGTP